MKRITCIAAMLILTLKCCLSTEGATRRAILIGLGEQLDKSWCKINGDKDVPLVASMLKSNGFTDIVTLINFKATKAGITNAFDSLIHRSQKGDIIYIQFSGHGQMMTDVDGDEMDGMDESWIPYDAYLMYCPHDKGEKHLSDDEIAKYMTRLRSKVGNEGTIAIVVDACHSGDSTRDLCEEDSVVVRGVDVDFKIPGKKTKTTSRTSESWLTLSACQDFQLNQEYNGVGKLTHILVNNWRNYAGHTDNDIINAIDATYETRKYKGPVAQNPQLSGQTGQVFSKIFIKNDF